MGIFIKRPLALFSFIFLITAMLVYSASNNVKLYLSISATVLVLLFLILSFTIKKLRVKAVTLALCLLAIVFSTLHSYVFIGIPMADAEKYVGENTALCYIVDEEYSSAHSKQYCVKITRIGEDNLNIKALLVCGFDPNISEGDEIYGLAEIEAMQGNESEQLVTVYMEDAENCYIRRTSEGKGIFELLFSDCGIELLSGKLSDFIKSELFELLGEEKGALAMGFFIGERSDIPTDVTRNFQRAGVSHLMAVSGSHIAILLGGIEIILRKLRVHKNIRCIAVTAFSVIFLFITGFSLSACRSVFMLYAVYIGYFTYEESDPITSLFVSVAVIVLIFPHSSVDLSLWMSFLATLGLLTVYPIVEEKIPYPRKKKRIIRRLILIGRELLLTSLMTVIANMFLLPIIWYYFGEFSLVSILSNILITFVSSVFILSVPLLLIFSRIPLLCVVLRWFVSLVADVILYAVDFCSGLPNATVSLKYEFCTYIVLLFAVSMAILLVVKLKRKLFVLLPYACAIVSFVICFVIYGVFFSVPQMSYINYGNNELFIVTENDEFSICDNTSGGLGVYSDIFYEFELSYATEIEKYILTQYHGGHIITLDLLSQNTVVRSVYLPTPNSYADNTYAEDIWNMATEKGIDVFFYNSGDVLKINKNVKMQALLSNGNLNGKYICFFNENKSVVYSTPGYCNTSEKYDILILSDSEADSDKRYDLKALRAERIYITSKELTEQVALPSTENIFIPSTSKKYLKIEFEFD